MGGCIAGAYHCQILDACFPGKVPLNKVNFGAKCKCVGGEGGMEAHFFVLFSAAVDYEFVKNFKVLQDVFIQQGVMRVRHLPPTPLPSFFVAHVCDLQWLVRAVRWIARGRGEAGEGQVPGQPRVLSVDEELL